MKSHNNTIPVAAAGLATLGAAGLAATTGTFAWSAPWPLSVAAGAVALVAGIWTIAGTVAVAKLLATVAPPDVPPDPGPEPQEPPRPRWEVAEPVNGFELDLIPQLQTPDPKPLLVQKANVNSPEDLDRGDVTFLLGWIYRHRRWSRRALKSRRTGPLLPRTSKRVTDYQYDELLRVLTEAEIVQERREGFTGYLCVQKLSETLRLFGFDPEKDRPELYGTVPNCTVLNPAARFVVTRVVDQGSDAHHD